MANWTIFLTLAVTVLSTVSAAKTVKLSSGHEMPVVGLGTGSLSDGDVEAAVLKALENGYRYIDTAFVYYNEKGIGRALKKWFAQGGKREELFITSKLPNFGNRPELVEKYLTLSLKDLGLNYIDMYLIHMPISYVADESGLKAKEVNGKPVLDHSFDPLALWKAMEEEVGHGHAKSIGLSNSNRSLVDYIYHEAKIKPSNLQIETHAYFQQRPLREFCKTHNIVVTGYAPLGSPTNQHIAGLPVEVEHPVVKEVAAKYKKTPAQVLLRYGVQGGLVVIPKSSHENRMKENIDIFDFELAEGDLKKLAALDQGEKGRIYDFKYHPGVENTPYYPFRSAETRSDH